MSVSPEKHLIKKYANRKLYDTRTSRYVTLEAIAELVRDGHEIKVVDRETNQDLTQVVLSQIVLSEEKRGPGRLMGVGTDALHERGQAFIDYVRKTLNVPAAMVGEVERRRSELETMVDEAIDRALKRIRIPSRGDIDRIEKQLEAISRQLNRNGRAGSVRASSRKRKASPSSRP